MISVLKIRFFRKIPITAGVNARNADMRKTFAIIVASSLAISAIAGRAGRGLQEKRLGVVINPLALLVGTREIFYVSLSLRSGMRSNAFFSRKLFVSRLLF